MAIQWAVQKCDFYLRGLPNFDIWTDHKPLVGIFDKCLHQLDNPRLTRMREKLTVYSFTVKWVEGKTHYIADALSRYPVFNPDSSIDAEMAEPELPEIVKCMRTTHAHGLQDICQYIDNDYKMIADIVESDQKWQRFSRTHPAMQYKGIMHRLSLHRTDKHKLILLDRTRIVIPTAARQYILKTLHVAHSGMTKTYKTVRQLYLSLIHI